MNTYDAIVIGSGQAGNPLAKKLAAAGWKTVLIEKRWIGGTCINDGCTPSKTMIASAKMAYLAGKSSEVGISIPAFSTDLPAIIRRKNEIVLSARNGTEEGLQKIDNLTLLFGEARFTGNKQVEVSADDGTLTLLRADKLFIDTGTKTTIPDIDGIDDIPYLTSTSILDLAAIPAHLLIIGAGYIALELGQMFRRFGSRVTIIEHAKDLLPGEDRDIADCLEDILKAEGLVFYKEANTRSFSKDQEGITAVIDSGGKRQEIRCSHVLLAAGRTPQTKQLQLDRTGVKVDDKGYIQVNDKLETSQAGIYALGDVKGGPAFTHIAYNDHLIVVKNILKNQDVSISGRMIPYCMFTDPQLGRVGLTEKQAKEQGINFKVAVLQMSHVARAIETGDTRGIMKAIVNAETKQILGVAVIGAEGGEIMSVLQLAMMGNITCDTIREAIFAHPLYSESLNNLFMTLDK